MTRFDLLHEFAEINKLDYNKLCVLVNTSVAPSEPSDVEILSLARLYSLDYANWPQRRFLQFTRDLLATPRAAIPDEKAEDRHARELIHASNKGYAQGLADGKAIAAAPIQPRQAPSDTLAKQHTAIRKVFKHHGLADPHTAVVADIIAIISETA